MRTRLSDDLSVPLVGLVAIQGVGLRVVVAVAAVDDDVHNAVAILCGLQYNAVQSCIVPSPCLVGQLERIALTQCYVERGLLRLQNGQVQTQQTVSTLVGLQQFLKDAGVVVILAPPVVGQRVLTNLHFLINYV